jgi:sugar transferase (PEP-CTERM/EpsH1 system associated)
VRVLFLSTWFPYPPDQGSRIRAYHLLKAVAAEHKVVLVSFQDRPLEPAWIEEVKSLCEAVRIVPRQPFSQTRLGAVLGWLSPRPRAVVGSWSEAMAQEVRRLVSSWQPDMVQANGALRVVDIDNLLALMLREEIAQAAGLAQRLRRTIAYWKLKRYERNLYGQFDLCLVTSNRDVERFQAYVPVEKSRITVVANGVDTNGYSPSEQQARSKRIVYSGAVTYQPNLDAMMFFANEILPLIQAEIPEVSLTISGSTDGVDVSGLAANPAVRFSGHVPDIRPLVGESAVCVVPLRKGAGTRLKVLEAMALGTPVVSTTKGVEGLDLEPGTHFLLADEPEAFARQVLRLLSDDELHQDIRHRARTVVEERYDWENIGESFREVLRAQPHQAMI